MAGSTTAATEEDLFAALDALSGRYGSSGGRPADDSLDQALDDVAATFTSLMEQLGSLPDMLQIPCLTDFEQRIAAQRLTVAARVAGSSGDSRTDRRRARDALAGGKGSSRSVARDAKRAAAMAANPGLSDAVANGSISPDALDGLAKAADSINGTIPTELVAASHGMTADQTADVVNRRLEDRIDHDEVEERYRRQMEARTVRRYRAGGLAGLAVEGPDQLVDAMWANLNAAADTQYRRSGGRDAPVDQRKPLEHRRFDAAHAALAGETSIGGSAGGGGNGTNGRPAVVVTVDGDHFFDQPDSPTAAVQLGSGPLPNDLVEKYLSSSPLSVLIRGSGGAPLWLGRTRRRATDQQFLALAVRDRGCVLCRANINQCEAHHLMPWHAPGRGRTDVDQMALLCGRCHGDLHHRNHTLYRRRGPTGHQVWATRPATPEETPRYKPQATPRE